MTVTERNEKQTVEETNNSCEGTNQRPALECSFGRGAGMPASEKHDIQSLEMPSVKKPILHQIKENFKCILLDIEGTTTPISFVHNILFPYILNTIELFLDENWDAEECMRHVNALVQLSSEDGLSGFEGHVPISQGIYVNELNASIPTTLKINTLKNELIPSLVKNIKWQMSIDRKIGPLKALQGYMWRFAYEQGKIQGVYSKLDLEYTVMWWMH